MQKNTISSGERRHFLAYLRSPLFTCLTLLSGIYLILTAFYCLLAYLPYTYYALVRAPAYAWMPVFTQHHALFYWLCVPWMVLEANPKGRIHYAVISILALVGAFLALHPILPGIQSDGFAYACSLVALALLAMIAATSLARPFSVEPRATSSVPQLPLGAAALVGVLVAVVYFAASHLRIYVETRSWRLHAADVEILGWSILSHVAVALVAVAILNLVRLAAAKSAHQRFLRYALYGALAVGALWLAAARFLSSALSFDGWRAQLFAAALAVSLTLWSFCLALPILANEDKFSASESLPKAIPATIAAALIVVAVALPAFVTEGDWNGFLQGTFTLTFWLLLATCIYRLLPRRTTYKLAALLAVIALTAVTYASMRTTAILWAKPLGSTDDEIFRSFGSYESRDVSFQTIQQLLGNSRASQCGSLCRILREYTNIRDAKVIEELKLVENLSPTPGKKPNIFFFVIDSLRPDYLGAYNPKATFSPHLDDFARDSLVIHNVYTQYAGTSLSEPAIWAGAMLLHAHYMQPFAKLNNLEKLAQADGYQMVVSWDEVLREILTPASDTVKLDADKALWNQLEICSTLRQANDFLDHRSDSAKPILFYTQPKNVHQFARNTNPKPADGGWSAPSGFSQRISLEVHQVDDCLGAFLNNLKRRGLYDNSIIILTSDHGDATGEFGRFSHSTSIYPEIMRVPLLIHLPLSMRNQVVFDDTRISTLTDITPSLYYLLGHRPVLQSLVAGRPMLMATHSELDSYPRDELFFASDVRAAYGLLLENGRYFYASYDSPAQSYLYDLASDPQGQRNILTGALKKQYDEKIIENLHSIADIYGFKPNPSKLFRAAQ